MFSKKLPKDKIFKTNFWCSFFTGKQRIMCSIIYLGQDIYMMADKWYDGIVELPYGDKFLPYGNTFEKDEKIMINKDYQLYCGGTLVGYCNLKSIIEIKYNKFDIKKDEQGNY